MPEPTHTGLLVAGGTAAAGALGALFRWALGRQVKRIDDHDTRIGALEKTHVTKEDLTHFESRLTSTITSSMAHLGERVGDVKATAEKAHDRIDRLNGGAK